jgi:hypothetical protein
VRLAHIALLASKGDASARGKRRAEALQILAELLGSSKDTFVVTLRTVPSSRG